MSKSAAKESRFSSPAEGNREIMRFSPIETSPAGAFAADLDTAGRSAPVPAARAALAQSTKRERGPTPRCASSGRGRTFRMRTCVLLQTTGVRVQSSWMKVRPQDETQSPPRVHTWSPLIADPV